VKTFKPPTSDVLNVKKDFVEYKRSRSAIKLSNLTTKGYAGKATASQNVKSEKKK